MCRGYFVKTSEEVMYVKKRLGVMTSAGLSEYDDSARLCTACVEKEKNTHHSCE